MYFNYGYERWLFDNDQKSKKTEYLAAGMSEEAIKELYKDDLKEFNSNRKEIKHRAHYQEMLKYDSETGDFQYMDMDEFSADEIAKPIFVTSHRDRRWIDEIENPHLYKTIRSLSDDYIEIISMKMDGFTDAKIAEFLGCERSTVSHKILLMKKILKIFV